MFRSIQQVIVNYLNHTPDPRTIDAMSMTLHDCIRLVGASKHPATSDAKAEAVQLPLNMKRNLESLQPTFIKSA